MLRITVRRTKTAISLRWPCGQVKDADLINSLYYSLTLLVRFVQCGFKPHAWPLYMRDKPSSASGCLWWFCFPFTNGFAVTAKLICAFVFAWAKIQFSHDAAQIIQVILIIMLSLGSTETDRVVSENVLQ